MYVGLIDGKRHTFQASGSLWQDALVMQDLETKTLWSQISGKGIQGSQRGTELKLYPSTMTIYAEFKKLYPNGKLLAKPERFEQGSRYDAYFSDSTKLGIFGRIDNFQQVPGKTKVIGLRLNFGAIAVTVDKLANDRIIFINEVDQKVVILYYATNKTAFAYDLAGLSEKQVAEISVNDAVLSTNGAAWDIRTGSPTDGESTALTPVPLITAFWFAWASFFPTSELIQ